MKNLSFLLVFVLCLSCSENLDDNASNLSFQINEGPRFASSTLQITNTTMDTGKEYVWEVASNNGIQKFKSENLSFEVISTGTYSITLTTTEGDRSQEKSVVILPPTHKVLNSLTLKEIPKNYDGLYFKILENNPLDGGSLSEVYQSEIKQNITASNAANIQWKIEGNEGFATELYDLNVDKLEDYRFYTIELFNSNDEFISRFDSFGDDAIYDGTSVFLNEEISLRTTRTRCADCDQFEITLDKSFDIR